MTDAEDKDTGNQRESISVYSQFSDSVHTLYSLLTGKLENYCLVFKSLVNFGRMFMVHSLPLPLDPLTLWSLEIRQTSVDKAHRPRLVEGYGTVGHISLRPYHHNFLEMCWFSGSEKGSKCQLGLFSI